MKAIADQNPSANKFKQKYYGNNTHISFHNINQIVVDVSDNNRMDSHKKLLVILNQL